MEKRSGDGDWDEDGEEGYGKPAGRVYLESGGEILHAEMSRKLVTATRSRFTIAKRCYARTNV